MHKHTKSELDFLCIKYETRLEMDGTESLVLIKLNLHKNQTLIHELFFYLFHNEVKQDGFEDDFLEIFCPLKK